MKEEKKLEEQFKINVNPNETPILYTDFVFMNTNEDGVVIDVCQKVGNSNQLHVVARLGMSRVHAKKLVKKLSELLALTEGHSQTSGKN